MITRKSAVELKVIENGVIVPAGLQINCLTIEERQRLCRAQGATPLSADEIDNIFGPLIEQGVA